MRFSYLTYIKLSTAIKRNENMAKGLQKALLQQPPEDDSKRSPRPQDLIRLYDIILQVTWGLYFTSVGHKMTDCTKQQGRDGQEQLVTGRKTGFVPALQSVTPICQTR